MNVTTILPQAASTSGTPSTNSNSGVPDSQSLNNMFLQLLVAQLQNQDPLNPLDPSQFVGQLAQFSELSEVTQIYQLLQGVVSGTSGSGNSNAPPQAGAGTAAKNPSPSIAPNSPTISPISLSQTVSTAAAAAQAALPNFASPAATFLNHPIQGVF